MFGKYLTHIVVIMPIFHCTEHVKMLAAFTNAALQSCSLYNDTMSKIELLHSCSPPLSKTDSIYEHLFVNVHLYLN